MSEIVVGIDLGTTYSAIAYVDDNGRPKAISNDDGKNSIPSIVLVENGRCTVGEIALNQWVTNEEHVVRWIKRAMGNNNYRFQGLSPVELSSEILKTLKSQAETALGQSLEEAVITCPAYFATNEIENTKKAGELAGFHVREIVKEPTAAAIYYGVEHMKNGETVLVCDLGGGTYDATVLAYRDEIFEPLASMGDRTLGGHDWTMDLLDLVADRLHPILGEDPRNDLIAGQMLYEACETAKRSFAHASEAIVPCNFRGRLEQVHVTRDEFEAHTEGRIEALIMWSENALQKAQLGWDEVNHVLLVGGSSRLRRMSLALGEAAGKKPVQTGESDLMVAYGAAIIGRGQVRRRGGLVERPGGLIEEPRKSGIIEVEFTRIIARSLGTRTVVVEGNKPRITNALIIPHSTQSPVEASRDDFVIMSDQQEFFEVPVVEFENDDDFEVVANYRFTCRPNTRRGDKVQVTFRYDISGIVSVDARDLQTGQSLVSEKRDYEEPTLVTGSGSSRRPRCVVFAIDTSFSMEGEKLETAKKALLKNAEQLITMGGGQCSVGIVSFDSIAKTVSHPTGDLRTLESAVHSMEPEGLTAMDEGIRLAVKLVLESPDGTDRDVVLLTDGMPDEGRRESTRAAARDAQKRGVTLSTVGISQRVDEIDLDYLRALTPTSLIIDQVGDIGAAIRHLLGLAADPVVASNKTGLMEKNDQ